MTALDLIAAAPTVPCRPWPRHVLTQDAWTALMASLTDGPEPAVLGLWADATHVHALFHDGPGATFIPVSVAVRAGQYPTLSNARPAAAWFERAIRDLWGHDATGAADGRPWLDHGAWGVGNPMAPHPMPAPGAPVQPELRAPAQGLHQIPVGPVHGDAAEPAHFRLTVDGEAIIGVEARLGYAHKGILQLMRGKSPRAAARFIARLSGDSTVAHGVAFARASEAAAGTDAPARAQVLRGVMGELERIANHLNDLGAVIGHTGSSWLPARLACHREAMREAAAAAFGHRLMMDCAVPGGLAADVSATAPLIAALDALGADLPALLRTYDESDGIADRVVGTGVVVLADAMVFAPGGIVGRSAGADRDLRVSPGYPPYDGVLPILLAGGDVDARLRARFAELPPAIALIRSWLGDLPDGPVSVPLPLSSGEGIGWAEGCRGDFWHWLRLEGGLITAGFARDPSWLHWPLLERAMQCGTVGDVPLCVRSFACSCSGVDL